MTREEEYEHHAWGNVRKCAKLKPKYTPRLWMEVMQKMGAFRGALHLVIQGEIQYGFWHLIQAGHPELTFEWEMVDSEWEDLFGPYPEHREAARWRLQQAGVAV
jgi:hypothetical protein